MPIVRKTIPPLIAIASSIGTLALVGLVDVATGRLAVILLYFLPIGLSAWYVSRKAGIILSFVATAIWFTAYKVHEFNGWAAASWNIAITLGTFLCYSVLLSALRSAKMKLEKAAEELARSNKDLQQFAYIVSHDLQEPLRTTKGFLELLDKRYADALDSKARQYIRYAVDGSERMSRLISDLLNYSRLNAQERRFESVDCNLALRSAVDSLQQAIRESGTEIRGGSLPTVQGMAPLLVQLLQNLIGNAIKYRERQRNCIVTIDAVQEEKGWTFSVTDNGIGIAPENQEKIFTVFRKLHRQEEYPGSGIGLAVCKTIVEKHGGRIWVQSKPGIGSSFQFTIPS